MIMIEHKTDNLPIKNWCNDLEDGAMKQLLNLSKHPVCTLHIGIHSVF